ncbi:MAG: hypothetical protein IKG93_03000 [Clostridiales bacterium]|jgi:hypothetical protein|nr:hypothetical protein [Clostridiales bacterium]
MKFDGTEILIGKGAQAVAVYNDQVLPQMWELGVTEKDFADAVKACFLMRQREKN